MATPPVFIASCGVYSRSGLIDRHGELKVREHERAFQYLVKATTGAKFQSKILEVGSVDGAWTAAKKFCLPSTEMEVEALR